MRAGGLERRLLCSGVWRVRCEAGWVSESSSAAGAGAQRGAGLSRLFALSVSLSLSSLSLCLSLSLFFLYFLLPGAVFSPLRKQNPSLDVVEVRAVAARPFSLSLSDALLPWHPGGAVC